VVAREGLHAADLERLASGSSGGAQGSEGETLQGQTAEAKRIRELEKELRRKRRRGGGCGVAGAKKKDGSLLGGRRGGSTRARKG